MLIKEYRIPLPLTVAEYQIAQLYMIQKKSREESEGEGSAVEILKNHPYTDGPNGSGQYTYKVYHIGRHLPGWFRNIAPKTALEVHEESWNAYPYTKTKFSVPFVDKFSIEVETYFEPDGGTQENKFKLSRAELRQRELDIIDIVNDQLTGNDYKKEEDPRVYVSKKNGRGPLADDWIAHPPEGVIMCSYKLIKVEFRYWGLQSKIERFIHDYGLRRVMLRAHRQAWAWQDEWVGLTIADIRRLERETQLILLRKLGRTTEGIEEEDELGEVQTDQGMSPGAEREGRWNEVSVDTEKEVLTEANISQPLEVASTVSDSTACVTPNTPLSAYASPAKEAVIRQGSSDSCNWERRRSSKRMKRPSIHSITARKWSNASSQGSSRSDTQVEFFLKRDMSSGTMVSSLVKKTTSEVEEDQVRWGLDQIELSDSDSDLEFFDAKDTVSTDEDTPEEDSPEEELLPDQEEELLEDDDELGSLTSKPTSSFGLSKTHLLRAAADSGDEMDPLLLSDKVVAPVDVLFLVLHGGSLMDPISDRVGKTLDFSTLQTNVKVITELHFRSAIGRIAMRMVPCKNVCNIAFKLLCQLSPVPVTNTECGGEGLLPKSTSEGAHSKQPSGNFGEEETQSCPCFLPLGTIPLIATECITYQERLKQVTNTANQVYRDFLESEEGLNFSGQVCLIGDCMGSVLGYDILTPSVPSCSQATPSPPPMTPSPTQQSSRVRKTSAIIPPSSGKEQSRERVSSYSKLGNPAANKTSVSPAQLRPHQLNLDQKKPSLSSLHSECSSSTSIGNLSSIQTGFAFDVTHFFAFGSPLGLLMASRRSKSMKTAFSPPPRPACQFFYNLFYGVDTVAARVEPLLDQRFATIAPISVPDYRAFPTGTAEGHSLKDTVVQHPYLFADPQADTPERRIRKKAISSECLVSLEDNAPVTMETTEGVKPFSVWWAHNRIDYILEAPWGRETLELLPTSTFSHIVHSRYWEAKEMVSFILRQVLRDDAVCVTQGKGGKNTMQVPFIPWESVAKWNRKTTNMRISHMRSNHRAVDVIAVEGTVPPPISAKFQYGPLDMASLRKEEVEMYIHFQHPKPVWEYTGSEVTDKHGKAVFNITRAFTPGLYPIKFLVKGDHTTASSNLFVVPPHVEAVVFSVDGALASNFSLSAKDIKLKHGAVEVARMWQELGYLIIYITGRPDLQKDYILNFLGCHGFPLGLVTCAEIYQSVKIAFLARLIKQAKIIIHAGYGSSRHLAIYKELGLQSDQIYIHGRKSKVRRTSSDCQYLTDGFASHHSDMVVDPPRKAMHDVREWFGDACFALPGHCPNTVSKKHRGMKSFRSQKSQSIDSYGKSSNHHRKGKYLAASPQTEV